MLSTAGINLQLIYLKSSYFEIIWLSYSSNSKQVHFLMCWIITLNIADENCNVCPGNLHPLMRLSKTDPKLSCYLFKNNWVLWLTGLYCTGPCCTLTSFNHIFWFWDRLSIYKIYIFIWNSIGVQLIIFRTVLCIIFESNLFCF